jgi:hypothetical protein
VTPGSAVYSERLECQDAEQHDVRKRLDKTSELARREMKIEAQPECGHVGKDCEDDVGGDDDRAPVAGCNGRDA